LRNLHQRTLQATKSLRERERIADISTFALEQTRASHTSRYPAEPHPDPRIAQSARGDTISFGILIRPGHFLSFD
jgi:hypothetical protein